MLLTPAPKSLRQHPIRMSSLSSPASGEFQPEQAIRFDNTFARLPDRFFARVEPTLVAAPRLIHVNTQLALELGISPAFLASPTGLAILCGNAVAQGSEPLAMAYAGHQFGNFVPQLGDGRANLLGEVVAQNGQRYDIQLKGSGRTPFSRGGDGRAALGPVLREYLVSEAMAALGVPTTRALAAVTTGDDVYRERSLPGAILTRVAASHLRVGSFQYFFSRGDIEGIRTLADYAIERHYPEAAGAPYPYRALLNGVVARHAALVAQWMLLGFIHGVMNTDNTSISGETLDFGPCAFLEAYHPRTVFSSIDRQGRYAYSNQPDAAHWNLTRLAETLLPLIENEAGNHEAALDWAYEALASFGTQYEAAYLAGMRRKLGLTVPHQGDDRLGQDLLERMTANEADFSLTFRNLANAIKDSSQDREVGKLFKHPAAFADWAKLWRQRLALEPQPLEDRVTTMNRANPRFIPRNHLVQAVLDAAIEHNDFQPFTEMLEVVAHPYDDQPGKGRFATPARPEQRVTATFCGT